MFDIGPVKPVRFTIETRALPVYPLIASLSYVDSLDRMCLNVVSIMKERGFLREEEMQDSLVRALSEQQIEN